MLLEVQSPSPSLYFILKISHIEFHLLKGSLSPPMRRSIRIIWLNDYHFLITLNVWENPQFNKTFKLLEAKKKKKKSTCTIISQIPVSDLHSIPHQSPN